MLSDVIDISFEILLLTILTKYFEITLYKLQLFLESIKMLFNIKCISSLYINTLVSRDSFSFSHKTFIKYLNPHISVYPNITKTSIDLKLNENSSHTSRERSGLTESNGGTHEIPIFLSSSSKPRSSHEIRFL